VTATTAVAASLAAVALTLGVLRPFPDGAPGPAPVVFDVSVAPFTVTPVDVLIDSVADRSGAMLTVTLSENLALDGYGEERVIRWQTELPAGRNLLRLPVVVKDSTPGLLLVEMDHGSIRKSVSVRVVVQEPLTSTSALSV
jgi:hypothetical protein